MSWGIPNQREVEQQHRWKIFHMAIEVFMQTRRRKFVHPVLTCVLCTCTARVEHVVFSPIIVF